MPENIGGSGPQSAAVDGGPVASNGSRGASDGDLGIKGVEPPGSQDGDQQAKVPKKGLTDRLELDAVTLFLMLKCVANLPGPQPLTYSQHDTPGAPYHPP